MYQIDETTIGVKWWGVVYLRLFIVLWRLKYRTLIHLQHTRYFFLYPLGVRSIKNYDDVIAFNKHCDLLDKHRNARENYGNRNI